MPEHILAIDQGTTSTRAIVFDSSATPVASAQVELSQHFPQPGWVEHDPIEIAEAAVSVAKQAISRASLAPGDRPRWAQRLGGGERPGSVASTSRMIPSFGLAMPRLCEFPDSVICLFAPGL